jgi:DNA (cytosine-5)-methyltransferase 1
MSKKVKTSKKQLVIEEENKEKKVYTAVSLFSGLGGDSLGMTQAGCKVIGYNELKPTFCKSHEANFKDCELICDGKITDISKLKDECFDKFKGITDILFAGFPCFVKDTLVLTNNGYKEIQNVVLEDKLLTHTGQFQNIVNLQRKEYNGQLYNIKLKYHPEVINCTEEHPFYVREKKKSFNNSLRKYEYEFGEPEWKNASKLTLNDHFGMVINSKEEIPTFTFDKKINKSRNDKISTTLDNPDQWFTLGYFVGDGWIQDTKKSDGIRDTHIIRFSFHEDDTESLDRIKKVLNITYKDRCGKGVKYGCADFMWFNILKQFGKYAHGKLIPEWVQDAPKHLVQEFINGYVASDGHICKNNITVSTVSHNLAYGLQRLYLKIDHIASVEKTIRPKTCVIEGRIVNQRDSYKISIYTEKQRIQSSFIEGNYVWYTPFKIATVDVENEPVYNFEVEIDNSYTVYNTIVHNCQGFSTAGKKAEDDPRNTLFLEFLRATKLLEPSLIIGENVKGLLTRKTSKGELYIDVIISEFEKIGYKLVYGVAKTEDFNVPQSRERLIIIGVKEGNPYGWKPVFPTKSSGIKPNLKPIVTYSMEGAVRVDTSWFSEIPQECIIQNLEDENVYPDNNNGHPYLLSKLKANEASRFYAGKQHETLFSFGKRDSPIHCEIVDIRKPSKTIICTYDHQPRLFVPIQNKSGCYLRMFTPDELKQIQGFPSDYILCGSIKDQIVQIGNAVPPPLIKAVIQQVINF